MLDKAAPAAGWACGPSTNPRGLMLQLGVAGCWLMAVPWRDEGQLNI